MPNNDQIMKGWKVMDDQQKMELKKQLLDLIINLDNYSGVAGVQIILKPSVLNTDVIFSGYNGEWMYSLPPIWKIYYLFFFIAGLSNIELF